MLQFFNDVLKDLQQTATRVCRLLLFSTIKENKLSSTCPTIVQMLMRMMEAIVGL